ncbi:MAG: ABC transporter ATP-binding protein [Alphaproteobacteria bacterium]
MTGDRSGSADLELRGAVKRFGAVTALAGVDLAVARGELLTILGPSGSGKTTLLKVVAGFETPDEGSVLLDGTDVTEAPASKRDIGMVFQNYALFPHMTVAENVAFPLEMRRVAKADIRRRVGEALAMVELGGYEARLPKQLSGGQQQRVALARAIVFDPRMLLLDEPFGALDRKLRETMQLEVRRLQRRLGLTTLFITHDQEEALILSDRIAVMSEGRLEQVGRPDEIYGRPRNRFVADFIGESNLLRGRVAASGPDEATVSLTAGPTLRAPPAPANVEVAALIRPEAVAVGPPAERLANRFDGEVVETVYLGMSVKYRIRISDGLEVLARAAARPGEPALDPGRRLAVGWGRDDVHLVPWG